MPVRAACFLALVFAITPLGTRAADHARVDAAIREFDDRVAAMRVAFARVAGTDADKTWVKSKLQHMVELDQFGRTFLEDRAAHTWPSVEFSALSTAIGIRMMEIDARNTADLKALLARWGWFSIPEFDALADRNGWLLVQHADQDPAFQQEVLSTLEPLVATGATNAKNYAYLYDRVAVQLQNPARRKPQRYGTQGQCTGPGTWEPYDVEDPATLDERRRAVGLEPIGEYRNRFKDVCHESAEETMKRAREGAMPAVR